MDMASALSGIAGAAFLGFLFGMLVGALTTRESWITYCVLHKAGKWVVDERTGEAKFKLNGEK